LYINPGFTRRIVGLKDEESDALLQLLFKVQARIRSKIAKR
jgi:sulfonate dioxygenase